MLQRNTLKSSYKNPSKKALKITKKEKPNPQANQKGEQG
jgi:hypothetical protein